MKFTDSTLDDDDGANGNTKRDDQDLVAEAVSTKVRKATATVQGDRFPMPDAKHARLALQMLPKAKNLSDAERAKIKARAHAMLDTKESVDFRARDGRFIE